MTIQVHTEATAEAPWPPTWARSVAFLTGVGLIIWETVIDKGEHLVVYGPAFLLTGLPIARGVERILDVIQAGATGSLPAPDPEPERKPEPPA